MKKQIRHNSFLKDRLIIIEISIVLIYSKTIWHSLISMDLTTETVYFHNDMDRYIGSFEKYLDVGNPEQVVAFDDILSQNNKKEKVFKILDFALLLLEQHDRHDYAALEAENARLASDLQSLTSFVQTNLNQSKLSLNQPNTFTNRVNLSTDTKNAELIQKYVQKNSNILSNTKSFNPLSSNTVEIKLRNLKNLKKQVEDSKDVNFLRSSFIEAYCLMELQLHMNINLIKSNEFIRKENTKLISNHVKEEQLEKLKNDNNRLNTKYQKMKMKYQHTREEIDNLSRENDSINSKFVEIKRKIEELKSKQISKDLIDDSLKDNNIKMVEKCSRLSATCIDKEKEILSLQNQINQLNIQRTQLENEIKQFKRNEEERERETTRIKAEYEKTIVILRNTIYQKSQEVAQKEDENLLLRKEASESVLNTKIESLRIKIRRLQYQLQLHEPQALNKQVEALESRIAEQNDLITYLQSERNHSERTGLKPQNDVSHFDAFDHEIELLQNSIINSRQNAKPAIST